MLDRTYRDPICGKVVPIDATTFSCVHGGETWFFCSRLCEIVFGAFPDQSKEIAREEAARRRDPPAGDPAVGTPGRRHGGSE